MKTNLGRPIMELGREDVEPIKLICFDSDGTTVKKGTVFEEGKVVKTYALTKEMARGLRELAAKFTVVISSGRSMVVLRERYREVDSLIFQAENGNMTMIKDEIEAEDWTEEEIGLVVKIREKLAQLINRNIKGFEPKEKIISLHCWEEIAEVVDIVKEVDRDGLLYCWWNDEAYDIGPKRINKGTALKKLVDKLGITMGEVMTVGNGINDRDLESGPGIDVSTDPKNLDADFVVEGEEAGGKRIIEQIIRSCRLSG